MEKTKSIKFLNLFVTACALILLAAQLPKAFAGVGDKSEEGGSAYKADQFCCSSLRGDTLIGKSTAFPSKSQCRASSSCEQRPGTEIDDSAGTH